MLRITQLDAHFVVVGGIGVIDCIFSAFAQNQNFHR